MIRRAVAVGVFVAGCLVTSSALASTTQDIVNLALANNNGSACGTNSLGSGSFDSSCTGNGGQPEYWCADFARWVWENTGVGNTNELTAAAGSFYVYGQNHGTLSNTPAIGDAVVFDYQGNGYADHVAIVTQVNSDGTIESISGDWNGQSGTEAQFSSTSSVVLNTPAYDGTVGTSPAVMGMTISGYIAPVGVMAGPPALAASYVSQGCDAPHDPTGMAYFALCTGQPFHFWFEIQNTGSAVWTDSNDTNAGDWGKAIRLGVPGDHPDPFTGTTRVSVNMNDNTSVDPNGGNCDNASGCNSTKFSGGAGIAGTAPATPGIYKTSWQLVDESRAWFGPTYWLSFNVSSCPDAGAPPPSGGGVDGGSGWQTGVDAGPGPIANVDGGAGSYANVDGGASGGDATNGGNGSSGGCSANVAPVGSGAAVGVVAIAALMMVRRRRRA